MDSDPLNKASRASWKRLLVPDEYGLPQGQLVEVIRESASNSDLFECRTEEGQKIISISKHKLADVGGVILGRMDFVLICVLLGILSWIDLCCDLVFFIRFCHHGCLEQGSL